MAAHTATHETDHEAKHSSEKHSGTAVAEHPTRLRYDPNSTPEALARHEEEVKKDEENRKKAFEDSPVFKRIQQRQEKAQIDLDDQKVITEEEAKEKRATAPPPAPDDKGEVRLPKGAEIPPASLEPYHPDATAWARPLAEPAE